MNYNLHDINPHTRKPVLIQGRVFFLAGTTGTRKTTYIRQKLLQISLPKFIWDIDREYLDFYNKPINRQQKTEEMEKFKKIASDLWEHCIIFSEAGIFLGHHTVDNEMNEILKGARKRGNWIFFDYHALSEIPVEMLRYCNYFVMKKTSFETPSQVKKFFIYPEVKKAYQEISQSANEFETRTLEPRKFKLQI